MKSLTKWLMLGVTTAALGGMLYADPSPTPAPAVDLDATSAAHKLSAADMQQKVTGLEARMKDDYRHVIHLKSVAERKKDVIKVNCVNDKLMVIKAQLNIADTAGRDLTAALTRNSDDRFNLYVSYDGAAQTVKTAREDANACVGESEIVTQANGVEVHHPIIPDDPAATNPFNYNPVSGGAIEPPAYASPFD